MVERDIFVFFLGFFNFFFKSSSFSFSFFPCAKDSQEGDNFYLFKIWGLYFPFMTIISA